METKTHDHEDLEIRRKLHEVVSSFDTAMLVTTGGDGLTHARPMRIVRHDDDGEMWFVTGYDTGKVDSIRDDLRVAVVMQGKGQYCCLSGIASVRDDERLLSSLWSSMMRPWFPAGPEGTKMIAIRFVPLEGEYWDMTGLEGIKYLFKAAKAAVLGGSLDTEQPKLHATISM